MEQVLARPPGGGDRRHRRRIPRRRHQLVRHGRGLRQRGLGKGALPRPAEVGVPARAGSSSRRNGCRSCGAPPASPGRSIPALPAWSPYPIDLYQIHNPLSLSSTAAQMKAMAGLVRAGKIKTVGVSNFGARRMIKAHRLLAAEGIPLVSNQVHYSLLKRGIESNGTMDAARELGITIIAYSPLDQGVLTGRFHEDPTLRKALSGLRHWRGFYSDRLPGQDPAGHRSSPGSGGPAWRDPGPGGAQLAVQRSWRHRGRHPGCDENVPGGRERSLHGLRPDSGRDRPPRPGLASVPEVNGIFRPAGPLSSFPVVTFAEIG